MVAVYLVAPSHSPLLQPSWAPFSSSVSDSKLPPTTRSDHMLFSQENSISLTLLTPTLSSELSLHHFLKNAFPIVPRLGQFLLLHDPTELCSIPSEHYPLFQGLCSLSSGKKDLLTSVSVVPSTARCQCSINVGWNLKCMLICSVPAMHQTLW